MSLILLFGLILTFVCCGTSSPQFPKNYAFANPFNQAVKPQNPGEVQGTYTFTDPNGNRRTVYYTGDGFSGFNIVEKPEPPKTKLQNSSEETTESDNTTPLSDNVTTTSESPKNKNPDKDNNNIRFIPIPVYIPPQQFTYRSQPPPYNPNSYRYPYGYSSFG